MLRAAVCALLSALLILAARSARAEITAWPEGCSAPYFDLAQLEFEYDASDLAGVRGIDMPRLAASLARSGERYRGEGWSAAPVGKAPRAGDRDRVLIIATLFPLAANRGTDRLVSRDSGPGLGIIQPDLSRSLTYDAGVMVLRTKGPADDIVNRARSQTACIHQSVAKVGLIECGTERYAPNAAHIRAIYAIGVSPLIDVQGDGSPLTLVSTTDYLDKAIAACLDALPGL